MGRVSDSFRAHPTARAGHAKQLPWTGIDGNGIRRSARACTADATSEARLRTRASERKRRYSRPGAGLTTMMAQHVQKLGRPVTFGTVLSHVLVVDEDPAV